MNGRRDDDEEDDYGVYGDEDILDRSIQEALPQRIEEKTEVSGELKRKRLFTGYQDEMRGNIHVEVSF